MAFGEHLYELTPRDLQVTQLEILNFFGQLTAAAVAVTVSYTVPKDKVLILKNYAYLLVPDPGQAVSTSIVRIDLSGNVSGVSDAILRWQAAQAVGVQIGQFSPCQDILVPPGASVSMVGAFNLPVNPNTVNFSLNGLLIPRGNISI